MTFALPDADGAISLMLRRGGYALSADGYAGVNGGSRLFSLTPAGLEVPLATWVSGNGPVRMNGKRETQLHLHTDFTQHSPNITGSWRDRSPDSLANTCKYGDTTERCKVYLSCRYNFEPGDDCTSPQGGSQFCSLEAGNWKLLKFWANPLPLQAPQQDVLDIGVTGKV